MISFAKIIFLLVAVKGKLCAGEKPWFLKISFTRPHAPYDPPERWFDYYVNKNLPMLLKVTGEKNSNLLKAEMLGGRAVHLVMKTEKHVQDITAVFILLMKQ